MDLPLDHSDLSYLPPDVAQIFALPSIETLLENDTETVTEDQWIEVAPDARLVVLKWWRDRLKQLVEYAVGGASSPPNEPNVGAQEVVDPESDTEDAIAGSIEALRATLSRRTEIWSFPEIIRHCVAYHFRLSIEKLLSKLQQPEPEDQELVKRLLAGLTVDHEGATSSQLIVNSRDERNLLCTRCDERIATYMTLTELITHYLDTRKWFRSATEAVQTSPDSCYPARAVDSELPKIINDHDWIGSPISLARQDDKEKREEVLKLQTEFRNEALNDPSCRPTRPQKE
ncbi:hypothetical protein FRC00_007362, partial [Tulasnella sp. 408]